MATGRPARSNATQRPEPVPASSVTRKSPTPVSDPPPTPGGSIHPPPAPGGSLPPLEDGRVGDPAARRARRLAGEPALDRVDDHLALMSGDVGARPADVRRDDRVREGEEAVPRLQGFVPQHVEGGTRNSSRGQHVVGG